MKKIIMLAIASLVLGFSSLEAKTKSNFRVDELIILPHPGRVLKHHAKEIGVTKEEMQRIKKEVKAVYPPIFQEKIRKALKIEQKVRRMVAKGKTKADVKSELDEIAKLKREAMDSRIDALNAFRKILGDEKWKKVINFKK